MMTLYILTAEAHAVNMCWPSGLARAPTDVIVPPPEMAMSFRLCQEASQHFRGTMWVFQASDGCSFRLSWLLQGINSGNLLALPLFLKL